MKNKVSTALRLDLTNQLAAGSASGGVVIQGKIVGIATQTHGYGVKLPCDMEGVFDVPVTDSVGGGIAIGDVITCTLATGVLSNAVENAWTVIFFGYSQEVIAAGKNDTINVVKYMKS